MSVRHDTQRCIALGVDVRRVELALVAGVITVSCLVGTDTAEALVCAKSDVVAVGKPAYFKFAAVSQARDAWRRKAVAKAGLGASYSHWGNARDSKITCRRIANRYRCVAVAGACRSVSLLVTSRRSLT